VIEPTSAATATGAAQATGSAKPDAASRGFEQLLVEQLARSC
jgi:hypothetical protein